MADRIDNLTDRVYVVEEEVDGLFTRVDGLASTMDQRFDEVGMALREQREYTESAYTRLEAKMDTGFARIERKLEQFIDVELQTDAPVEHRLSER